MRFALDWDQTYTADPGFWRSFMMIAEGAGHEVCIVTARDERYDITPQLAEFMDKHRNVQVVFCRGVAKQWYCKHFVQGGGIDVWIDDRPASILHNSCTAPEWLAEWRAGDRA